MASGDESLLPVPSPDEKLKDRGDWVLYYHFVMIGTGVLISWNAIATSFDWMNTVYPQSYKPSLVFTMINFIPNLIFMPLTIIYGPRVDFNLRIIIPFLAMGILLAATPFIVKFIPTAASFVIMCIVAFVIGSFNAVAQTSVFGLAGCMPNRYSNAVMVGNGVAGVLICIVQCICLGAFWRADDGLLLSSIVYFIVAGLTLVICLISQWLLMKNEFVQERVSFTGSKMGTDIVVPVSTAKEMKGVDDTSSQNSTDKPVAPSVRQVYPHLWQYSVLVFTCYVVTFGLYPTACIAIEAKDIHYAWFAVLMLLTFNLFDFCGRNLPALYLAKGAMLWILVLARFIFWVTFMLVDTKQPPSWIFGWDATWFKFLNMALFAVSNGFTSTCCMILGPAQVKSAWKDKAGSIMSTSLVWGIVGGALMAFAFSPALNVPEE
jgi:equilibrative nucleoside transporter 1/2/3